MRRSPGALQITATNTLPATVVQECRRHLAGDGSVGVIAADAGIADLYEQLTADGLDAALLGLDENAMESARLVCVPASLAKGLEFDTVVLVEPARIMAAEPRGLNRLYVALTRAVSTLHVLHAQPLPAALHAPPGTAMAGIGLNHT